MPLVFEIQGSTEVISAEALDNPEALNRLSTALSSGGNIRLIYRDTSPQSMLGNFMVMHAASARIDKRRYSVSVMSQHAYPPTMCFPGTDVMQLFDVRRDPSSTSALQHFRACVSSFQVATPYYTMGSVVHGARDAMEIAIALSLTVRALRDLKRHSTHPLWPYTNLSSTTPSSNLRLTRM